jgi:3-deoxy-7-phosphoheptulonate synthase
VPGTAPILENRRVEATPLVSPRALRSAAPLSATDERLVDASRAAVRSILDGRDDRLLVVVGPCSVHDPEAALDYAARLQELAGEVDEQLLVVMRVYFEKPRTAIGWKGLINDPRLDGSHRIEEGLGLARNLLLSILSVGLPVGCEFLDPFTPGYLDDTVSWGAIGARTAQSQIHRQLASGLSMPIGFKNSTDGDVQSAVDGVLAAAHPHAFPGMTDDGSAGVLTTHGNPDGHIVLRGGQLGPNYGRAEVATAAALLARSGLPERVVIDASHGNSAKDHRRQLSVLSELTTRIGTGERELVGLMIESFLVPGRQDFAVGSTATLRYGQSITDACIGWDDTARVLRHLAAAIARRRHDGA